MSVLEEKVCGRCNITKPVSEFRVNKEFIESTCKQCVSIRQKENPNRQKTLEKYRKTEKYRTALRRGVVAKYGLTLEEFEEMVAMQNGVCKICGNPESRVLKDKITELSVDHCHATQKIRGLLCDNCNVALGRVKDNINILKNMIVYLEEVR